MRVDFTEDEFDELWEWYVRAKNGVPYNETFGNLLNRMHFAVPQGEEPTMTLPGPDGGPNVEVPLEFFG